ncbi:MAG: hypothetical protein D6785_03640 [Planctomycetota bacterium]|nr:MAG: hypothetical protein D6785_03640 [Planctomycetota bacterium]
MADENVKDVDDDEVEAFSFDAPVETPKCKCGCGEPAGATGYASPACEKKGEILGGLDDLVDD